MLRYAVLIAVACLFFNNVQNVQSESNRETILYEVVSKMRWRFSNSKSQVIKFDLTGDWYVQRKNKIENSYYSGFRNVKVVLDRKSSKNLNLDTCESFRKLKEALEIPCLVFYDQEFTFKGIQYNKNDLPASRHLKYTYGSFLQVNTTLLKLHQSEPESFVHTTEAIGELGTNCTANYEIKPRPLSKDVTTYFLNKFLYGDTCTKDTNPEDYVLTEICNLKEKKKFTIEGYYHINFELGNNIALLKNVTLKDIRTFIPWKKSSEKIIIDLRTGLYYKETLKSYELPRTPEINSDFQIYMTYTHPDESVIHGKTVPDLRKLYKALSCDASVETTERELLGEFIKCDKELK